MQDDFDAWVLGRRSCQISHGQRVLILRYASSRPRTPCCSYLYVASRWLCLRASVAVFEFAALGARSPAEFCGGIRSSLRMSSDHEGLHQAISTERDEPESDSAVNLELVQLHPATGCSAGIPKRVGAGARLSVNSSLPRPLQLFPLYSSCF